MAQGIPTEEYIEMAKDILKKLNDGENFQQVAISFSNGQKALEGGSLGWRKAGQLPTLFSTAVTQLRLTGRNI